MDYNVYFNQDVSIDCDVYHLPPSATGIWDATWTSEGIQLVWFTSDCASGYYVYRGTESGFTPAESNKIANTGENLYFDTDVIYTTFYYYKVSAYNYYGESGYSEEQQVVVGQKGDVDGDAEVNVLDVVRTANIIMEIPPIPDEFELWAADCNEDGAVNIIDAIGIVNVILEIGSCGPTGQYLQSAEFTLYEIGSGNFQVFLDNPVEVKGIELHFNYNSILDSLQNTSRSDNLNLSFNDSAFSDSLISVQYGTAMAEYINTGSGPILELYFSSDADLRVTKAILSTPNAEEIPVTVINPPDTVDLYPVKDAAVCGHPSWQSCNCGAGDWISTGGNWMSPLHIYRSLVQFNLSTIPNGSIVETALLHFYVGGNSGCLSNTQVNVYRMKHSWTEGTGLFNPTGDGATWLTSDGSTNWLSEPGAAGSADCEQTPVGGVTIPYLASIGQKVTLSLDEAAVEQMLAGGSFGNHGFLIKDSNEIFDMYEYYSSEHSSQSYRPRLEIIYRAGTGGPPEPPENEPPSITIINPPSGGDEADDSYTITWSSNDPDGDVCTVDLYYDTDTSPGGTTQIVSNTTDDGSHLWSTSSVAVGSYYIYGKIDDGNGGTDSVYSAGSVNIDHGGSQPPHITSLNPSSGPVGYPIYVYGSHFGDTQGSSYVTFFQDLTAIVNWWTDNQIQCVVPVGTQNGNVTVTTSCGTSNGVYFESQGGCPYVAPWVGGEYLVGNNILVASEDTLRPELDVTDFFRLEHSLDEREGLYWIKIREFEQEHTWLDEVRLLAVDHPQGLHLGVKLDGEMFLYSREILPVSCVDSAGVDRLGLINTIGDGDYEAYAGEWLTVDFGHIGNVENMYVEVVADLPPPPPKRQTIVLQLQGEHEWEWQDIALLHPRQNWATHLIDLSPWLNDGPQDIVIRLYWLAQHKVDYIDLVQLVPGPIEKKECVLESAVHSEAGSVRDSLLTVDGKYAELVPGEQIELSFEPAEPTGGFVRDFVVVATGHYVTGAPAKAAVNMPSRVPTEFSLAQNYPNPFNPETEIAFSLPEDSKVTLTVYNILGQVVDVLPDSDLKAGYHKMNWSGQDFASGIYFYRLTARGAYRDNRGEFSATKRMLLLK